MDDLLDAVLSGDISLLSKLIKSGVDINYKDEDERTLLINAIIEREFNIVEYLIQNGADVDIQDLVAKWSPLHFAAQQCCIKAGNLLLKNGAIVDIEDINGYTPLNNAVFYSRGNDKFVKLLLNYGADKG